eukprot:gene11622-34330_t
MKIVLAASAISATAAALVVAKSTLRRRKAIVLAASPRQNVLDTPGVSIIHRGSSLATSNPDEFSILSFNVLADKYLRGKLVPGVPPEYLQWEHRSKLLDEELGASNADIICLQEVEPNRWEEVCALPSLAGYTCLLQDRQKDKEARAIALAIFFKAPRFELLWTESRSRVLLAALRFKDSYGLDQVLYLMNLHLEGSPHRPHDRLSQMRSALQRLQQCQQEQQKLGGPPPEDCTTAIVGDFNSTPLGSVYGLLQSGRIKGGSTEPHLPGVVLTKTDISHPYLLQDVYMKEPHASLLDFMWASADCEVRAVYNPYGSHDLDVIK